MRRWTVRGPYLVDEHEDKAVRVLHHFRDLGEQLGDQLTALAEPLGEEAVRIDLDEEALGVAVPEADGQLLRERLAETRLAGARGPVQQHHPGVQYPQLCEGLMLMGS